MLSPQFLHWADRDDINAVIDYALRNYRINPSRIYLTGLSMGGGSILEFAGKSVTGVKRIAALTTAAGAYGIDPNEANNLASVNLPVWATHNSGDGTVGVEVTIRNVDTINNYTRIPPTPRAKKTIFNVGGHDAWSQTYDPNFRDNGLNVYEWMLQFQLGITSPLPVIMGEYTAFLSDESAVTVNWTTVTESHNKYFVLEKSTDGARFSVIDTITAFNQSSGHAYTFTDRNVAKGNNFYRLSQVDDDGKITYFKVLSVLVPVQLKSYFKISPNPASAAVLLDLMHPETGSIQVVLSDMQGRTIRTWKFEKQNLVWQQSLDVSSLAPGNYTILLKGNTISQVQRLVKQ
jgi:hypothetical protein